MSYDASPFLIYTNYIMPGTWTLYHRHRTDLLALIASDAQVSGQVAGEAAVLQRALGGTAIFFPYGDLVAHITQIAAKTCHNITRPEIGPGIPQGREFEQHALWCAGEDKGASGNVLAVGDIENIRPCPVGGLAVRQCVGYYLTG